MNDFERPLEISENEKKRYELMKIHNQINAVKNTNTNNLANNNEQVLKLVTNNSSKPNQGSINNSSGFTSALLVTLITGFAGGVIATILYIFLNR